MLFRMAAEPIQEGDTVWDVGANVGLFAFAAAGFVGPTEVKPRISCEVLRQNMER